MIFFISSIATYGQSSKSHELGLVIGMSSFSTDFGERYEIMSSGAGNLGFGIGALYYMNFTDYRYRWNQRTTYFSEHARLRAEISYITAKLDHFGKWAARDSYAGEQLRAMHGEANVINAAAQLEFHWVDVVDYGSRRIPDLQWSPFLSLGFGFSFYNADLWSDLGDWREDPSVFYPKWAVPGTTKVDPGITTSISWSLGTRYAIGEYSDVFIESRWRYYFSNWVDGLDAEQDPSNKYQDWSLFLHIGFIYYLN